MDKIIPCQGKLPLIVLNILASDCQVSDEADNQNREYQGDRSIAQAKPAQAVRFPKPVGKRGTKRASYDIRKPEGKNSVQAKQKVANRRYNDQYRKQHTRGEIAHIESRGRVESVGSQVTSSGAKCERRHYRGPIKQFAATSVDAVYR